jgi:hypothetical protein
LVAYVRVFPRFNSDASSHAIALAMIGVQGAEPLRRNQMTGQGEYAQGMTSQGYQMACAPMQMPMQPIMQGVPGQPQMVMLPQGAHPQMIMHVPVATQQQQRQQEPQQKQQQQ